MFPSASSSSFDFNRNLQEFNEESTHTIAATSSSAILYNNNQFSSMMITHGELDEKSNLDEKDEEFHCKKSLIFHSNTISERKNSFLTNIGFDFLSNFLVLKFYSENQPSFNSD